MRRFILIAVLIIALARMASAEGFVLITILHTNDLHGHVMSNADSGLAKAATLVRQIRAEMPNVILIDGGDTIHGSYEDYFSGGLATITAMNATGYNAMAAGNHEFDFGLPVTSGITAAALFPVLAANLKDRATGTVWNGLAPYTVITISGVRIGIFGLITPELLDLEWPPSIAGITVEDPIATAKVIIPELRQKADIVIALTHLGYDRDVELAQKVQGIDFIVGGHSHTAVNKWKWVGDTLVTQAGEYGDYLGRIDLIASIEPGGAKIQSVNGKNNQLWNKLPNPALGKVYPTTPLIPVDKTLPDDPAVVAAYKPYRDRANVLLSEIIGNAAEPVPAAPSLTGESVAGDFVADAVRAAGKSDIAIIDSSSMAGGLVPGVIDRRAAFNMIQGFTRQQIIVVRAKGSDIVLSLSSRVLSKNLTRLQVSGLTFSYSVALNGTAVLSNVNINGQPIDPLKDYTVAGQAYVIQNYILRPYPTSTVVAELQQTTREAIVDYVRSVGKVVSPVTGRITSLQPAKYVTPVRSKH